MYMYIYLPHIPPRIFQEVILSTHFSRFRNMQACILKYICNRAHFAVTSIYLVLNFRHFSKVILSPVATNLSTVIQCSGLIWPKLIGNGKNCNTIVPPLYCSPGEV